MLNKVCLMGRLTKEPELKHTRNNVPVTSFTLAVERNFTKEKQTDFINIIAWRNTAEFVSRYFGKGSLIALTGAIQTRSYEDKNGDKRTAFEVVADEVFFTGERRESALSDYDDGDFLDENLKESEKNFAEADDDDEIPF